MHGAGGEPVDRVGLVARACHQGRKGQRNALRAVALEDVAVERIERLESLVVLPVGTDLRKRAALGGVRIDVVEMREIRRIFEIAERRESVGLGIAAGFGGRDRARQAERKAAGRERQ